MTLADNRNVIEVFCCLISLLCWVQIIEWPLQIIEMSSKYLLFNFASLISWCFRCVDLFFGQDLCDTNYVSSWLRGELSPKFRRESSLQQVSYIFSYIATCISHRVSLFHIFTLIRLEYQLRLRLEFQLCQYSDIHQEHKPFRADEELIFPGNPFWRYGGSGVPCSGGTCAVDAW